MKTKRIVLLTLIPSHQTLELMQEVIDIVRLNASVFSFDSDTELINYLRGHDCYADRKQYPYPSLVLMTADLAQPSTFSLLKTIENCFNSNRKVPLVVVSNDHTPEQLKLASKLGVVSTIRSAASFDSIVKIMQIIDQYWLQTVKLPPAR